MCACACACACAYACACACACFRVCACVEGLQLHDRLQKRNLVLVRGPWEGTNTSLGFESIGLTLSNTVQTLRREFFNRRDLPNPRVKTRLAEGKGSDSRCCGQQPQHPNFWRPIAAYSDEQKLSHVVNRTHDLRLDALLIYFSVDFCRCEHRSAEHNPVTCLPRAPKRSGAPRTTSFGSRRCLRSRHIAEQLQLLPQITTLPGAKDVQQALRPYTYHRRLGDARLAAKSHKGSQKQPPTHFNPEA